MKSAKEKIEAPSRSREVKGRSRHRLSAGKKILAAIEEATDLLREEGLESKRLTIRTYNPPSSPIVLRSGDVKRVRERLGASQAVFAGLLGVNVNTVRSWEQGKRLPQPIACRFLSEIESNPMYWRRRIERSPLEDESGERSEGS